MADLDEARRLFREFLTWHLGRQADHLDLVTAYFDDEAWEAEIAGLPGEYAAPDGALLLAFADGPALGCVGLRRLSEDACEMKRLYVGEDGRGRGLGQALAEAVVARARDLGYREMLLDTSVRQHEAIGLYRRLGFVETAAFHDVPEEMRDWLVFFRLTL